ncbi:MAG: 50S ribosome-binding GTPase [Candidatus Hydrogenedentes bacterium]|nr:50S ribosome-binding GTPase [Candidatus Hydrogenedentota bacterium]
MDETLGNALVEFHRALEGFQRSFEPFPLIAAHLLEHTGGWRKQLAFKLLPHLGGNGCLIAAVAGGTNTGKSTVFNLLLGEDVSPVRTTAAATCRPLLAANALRAEQGLAGELLANLVPQPLESAEEVLSQEAPEATLYIIEKNSLPDRLVLLDIPDVDSIVLDNWEVARNIQAAGDVLIAVLTGEKYKDEKVVSFFRAAAASGRVVLPLMNKANPGREFAVARAQVQDFCTDTGLIDAPSFVIAHDFALADDFARPIPALNAPADLRSYLESLDVEPIKRHVFQQSLQDFVSQSGDFIARLAEQSGELDGLLRDMSQRAGHYAAKYDPEPDASVGKLLHTFIRSKRGPLSRTLGQIGAITNAVVAPVGRMASRAIRGRLLMETGNVPAEERDIRAHHEQQIIMQTRDLVREFIPYVRALPKPVAALIEPALDVIDIDGTAQSIIDETLRGDSVSDSFRAHAEAKLEEWWSDHKVRRQVLIEIDALLMFTPTAIALPLAMFTGGVGVPEVMALGGPLAGEFFSRIMEQQFADQWFDLLAPWRKEQQARLQTSFENNLIIPLMGDMAEVKRMLDGEPTAALRRSHEACQKHL